MIARRWSHAVLVVWAVAALGSCGKNPNGPTPPPTDQNPAVTSIAPPSGTTLGGTAVTIIGRNFAAGATVTVGGVAATNVQVTSPTTITAQTGQHAAGAADVIVTLGSRTASLPNAYTFTAPAASTNAPPTITGISSRSARPNVPSRFADLDETITVTATVIDAETPTDQLKYEWTAESGTISGTGREISWRAPAQANTPTTSRLTLTVTETYQTTDSQGLPTTAENRVNSTFDVRVHASAKEVRDMAVDFLVAFSQQRLSPDQIVSNFSDTCPGKVDERNQIRDNQRDFTITTYSVEPNPRVDVAFGGVCRNRDRGGDACAYVSVRWVSTVKADGKTETATGTDQVNAIYENNRWRLCDSDFVGTTTRNGRLWAVPFKK